MTPNILATLVTNLPAPSVHGGFTRGTAAASDDLFVGVVRKLSPSDEVTREDEESCALFCVIALVHLVGNDEEILALVDMALSEAARRQPSSVLLIAVPSGTLKAQGDLEVYVPSPRPEGLEIDGLADVDVEFERMVSMHINIFAGRNFPPSVTTGRALTASQSLILDESDPDLSMSIMLGSL